MKVQIEITSAIVHNKKVVKPATRLEVEKAEADQYIAACQAKLVGGAKSDTKPADPKS